MSTATATMPVDVDADGLNPPALQLFPAMAPTCHMCDRPAEWYFAAGLSHPKATSHRVVYVCYWHVPASADARSGVVAEPGGTCGRYWDDGIVTGLTSVPSARCPFEYYH